MKSNYIGKGFIFVSLHSIFCKIIEVNQTIVVGRLQVEIEFTLIFILASMERGDPQLYIGSKYNKLYKDIWH